MIVCLFLPFLTHTGTQIKQTNNKPTNHTMGKGAYIRIQNKTAAFPVTIQVENRRNVHDKGLESIQGTVAAGNGQLPATASTTTTTGVASAAADGTYYYYASIEGEPKLRFQKDGYFYLVASAAVDYNNDDNKNTKKNEPFKLKLSVDREHWWSSSCCSCCSTHTHHHQQDEQQQQHQHAIVMAADVFHDDDNNNDKIEVRIFESIPTSHWMEHLQTDIAHTPLCQVAMPGTHDSGTYQWDPELGASPDSNLTVSIQDKLDKLGKVGDVLTDKILDQVFERMCQCQDMSIQQQLQAGVRYLDLRVAYHADLGKFYTCHGVFCVDMVTILQEINDFLTAHSKEIVILDFNHLYAMEAPQHTELAAMIVDTLGDKVAVRGDLQPNSPVQQYWDAGAQAVIVYHDGETQRASDNKLWFKGCLKSPWPNKNDTQELKDKLEERFASDRQPDKFFVLQGILTPDGELIKEEILGSGGGSTSIKSIAGRVSGKVVDWVENDWKDQQQNVVIVDFFQDCCMVPAIINLNRKQR